MDVFKKKEVKSYFNLISIIPFALRTPYMAISETSLYTRIDFTSFTFIILVNSEKKPLNAVPSIKNKGSVIKLIEVAPERTATEAFEPQLLHLNSVMNQYKTAKNTCLGRNQKI